MCAQEMRRRLWHFFPGVLAFTLPVIPHMETVRLWVMLVIVAFGIILPALAAIRYQRAYCRSLDEDIAPSIFGYVIPLTLLCLMCRSNLEIPLAVAAIISFGDGCATLVGILTRGPRVPWNARKSWAGLVSFMVMGSLMATAIYWAEANPHVPLTTALLVVAPVVMICGLVETLPLKLNDNLTVGFTAAALLLVQQTLIVGWN